LHWSIFPLEKWNVLWESPKSFRLDSEVLTEEKTREKHGEKKGTENDLPYTYGDATFGDVISGEVTNHLTIHLKY
jgi:hypothetical protein